MKFFVLTVLMAIIACVVALPMADSDNQGQPITDNKDPDDWSGILTLRNGDEINKNQQFIPFVTTSRP